MTTNEPTESSIKAKAKNLSIYMSKPEISVAHHAKLFAHEVILYLSICNLATMAS